jgi:flagellar M-ring protein FliF
MDQIKKLIGSLSLKQKFSLVVVALAVAAAMWSAAHWNRERGFKPLFTGLAAEDAGQLVQRLKDETVDYRLSDNGTTILVSSAQVAEIRLRMAAQGLPQSGRLGFELFDQTTFGTTDFAEQVNYQRALEGELERSVMALTEVERSRVHLTLPKESVFMESRRPGKGSVMVKLLPGAKLDPQNVRAICHLVSSAVEGLDPESVSVLDMRGNLLSRPRKRLAPGSPEPSDSMLDYKRSIERDLLAKIATTLDPLLGPDGFRAGVNIECDFSSGEQNEEIYDPTRSVMATSEKTEDASGNYVAAGGVPGTASSLPRSVGKLGKSNNGHSRRSENIAYQTSRTVRRTVLPQGTLKRVSVSLLVDHEVRWEGEGEQARRTVSPVSGEKLNSIRDLVGGAIGLQPERGDQLIVESLPFESTRNWHPEPALPVAQPLDGIPLPSWLTSLMEDKKKMLIVGAGVGGALLLLLVGGFIVIRKLKRKSSVSASAAAPALSTAEDGGLPAIEGGERVEAKMQERLSEQAAMKARLEEEALKSLKIPTVKTKKTEVLTKHISEEAEKDPIAMAQLVRTWLNQETDDRV